MYTNKNIIATFLIITLFIKCNNVENENEITDIFDPDVSTFETQVGEPITFTDYSVGVVSRLWTFPNGTPSSSSEEQVTVVFNQSGPISCTMEGTFSDGFTDRRTFNIQVGNELYSKSVFGFEDVNLATETWGTWVSDDSNAMEFSINNSTGEGANGSNGFAKIILNTAGVESQLYTKGTTGFPNATLESNTFYEFGFWIKSNDISEITAAELSNQSESQETFTNFVWMNPVTSINNSWSYKTLTFQTGNLANIYAEGTANNAYTQFKFIPSNTGTIYIDDISLKKLDISMDEAVFFKDATITGSIFHNGASEISNPLSDSTNSSNVVIKSDGTSGWRETQFLTFNYTIKENDKFHISFYNPNGASQWQLRMDLSNSGTYTQIGNGDIDHTSDSTSGWSTTIIDLSEYSGEELTKFWIFSSAGESIEVFYDDIFISQ